MAEHSGDDRYLDEAADLLALTDLLTDGWEAWASAGKVAWGAARAYRATGDKQFRILAGRVARRCFVKQQRPDGRRAPFHLKMVSGGAGYHLPQLELTAEFTLLAADVARCLAR